VDTWLQGSLHPEWCIVPIMPINCKKYSKEEQAHAGHRVFHLPHKEMCRRPTDELGKYLFNQLELYCREAQDQGYEFHFSWLLILITFIAWEMTEGVTFLDIKPFEPLATKFTMLWYSSDMGKKWQSNAVFHTYYLQLKRDIEAKPRMTPNTLQWF
jgi:hypothetical protein